jgi:hypothetical protein
MSNAKRHFIATVALIPATVLLCVSPAFAGPRKPAVCRSFAELKDGSASYLICKDGKRPSVWTGSYAVVKLPWGEVVAVGYRSQPRSH